MVMPSFDLQGNAQEDGDRDREGVKGVGEVCNTMGPGTQETPYISYP